MKPLLAVGVLEAFVGGPYVHPQPLGALISSAGPGPVQQLGAGLDRRINATTSTTFTVLRRARVAFAKRRRARDGVPLDAWGRPEDDDQVVVVASWVYVGSGYETEGERWLAVSAAARAREQRRVAWEELRAMSA